MKTIFSVLTFVFLGNLVSADLVRALPLFATDQRSEVFQLNIDGSDIPVAYGAFNGKKRFHHARVEIDGPVEATLRFPGQAPEQIKIAPSRHQIEMERRGSEVRFTIADAYKLTIQAEGIEPLFIFCLPPESERPNPEDENVVFFGPGVHEVGEFRPQSGQTIYLAPDAVVKGRLYAFEVENIQILGRGLWDARGYTSFKDKIHGMLFERSKNIKIEGIQLRTGDWWQTNFLLSSDIQIEHMMLMSFGKNNDGIDLDGVTNLTVRNSFIGCGDDGFGWHALDAVTFGEPASRNLLAEDCVIWNEHAGNGLRIGASMETSVFENITFRDIDVVHVRKGGRAIMMDHSDWAHTRNVLFERFINESGKPLMEISTEKTRYSNSTGYRDERGLISDLYFHQVHSDNPTVRLRGADAEHGLSDFWFVNCTLDGKPLTSSDGFSLNGFVTGMRFVDTIPERKVYPVASEVGRDLEQLTIDDGDAEFWAFGGDGLQRVQPIERAIGHDLHIFDELGWGHAGVYVPNLSGNYEIFIHWVSHPGQSSKTPWTVQHRDGYRTKVFGAQTEEGWHSLGTFTLESSSWVRLVDPHYRISDGLVVADAVKFLRKP